MYLINSHTHANRLAKHTQTHTYTHTYTLTYDLMECIFGNQICGPKIPRVMPDKSQRHQNVARPSWPPRGTERRDVADAVAADKSLSRNYDVLVFVDLGQC